MSRAEIEEMLERIQIPFRYFMFEEKEAVSPPFMVWYLSESRNFFADGSVYARIDLMNVELYTDKKDFNLEYKVETELNRIGLHWQKTESFLDEEKMYEVLYEMEVMIHEQEEQD